MDNKDMLRAYKKNIQHVSLSESIYGAILAVISFSFFIYADIYVYKYPSIITYARTGIILFYLSYFLLYRYFRKGVSNKVFKGYYFLAFALTFGFGDLLNVITFTQMPELSARTIQVTMAITIGCALFAGPIRDVFGKMLLINFVFFMGWIIYLNGFSIFVVFEFYNFAFYTVAVAVFNYYYQKSKYDEFVSKEKLKLKLIELEGEIIAKEEVQKSLKKIASFDALTGFYSRSVGMSIFEEFFHRSIENKGHFSICYMDLDGLKEVNDKMGHKIGDELIKTFSRVIRESIRSTDICVRIGGDEFVLLLPDVSDENAQKIWSTILRHIEMENDRGGHDYRLACSHGIVERSVHNLNSSEEMLDLADQKMYQEKLAKKEKLKSENISSILESEMI